MITLRCTRKLLQLLDGAPVGCAPEATAALGNWYGNVVPTVAGELVVLVNERTLLSVAIPARMVDRLFTEFPARVYNLLRMIGVPPRITLQESAELETVMLARTESRSVLGSLNEVALQYQLIAEHDAGHRALSLSAAERTLSHWLHSPLDYVPPADIAAGILAERYGPWEQEEE
ncbi:MAG TPA: hypothetical protein ENN96_00440 [Candidatus Acetothermia bacterium]|mgnify:CR=1 FL=1|nr:hypothetical protein [Candidatus Acetothermia bacterium]